MTENFEFNNLYENDISEIAQTIKRFLGDVAQKDRISLPTLKLGRHTLKSLSEIILTGSGQSFYAAEAMAHNIEMLTDLPTYAIPSALLKGTRGVLYRDAIVIAVSQSGESFDTIDAVRRAQKNKTRVVAITAKDSTLAKMCKNKLLLPEISGVLCTFQNTYFALCVLGMYIGFSLGCMTKINMSVALKFAQMLPGKLSFTQNSKSELGEANKYISKFKTVILCGYSSDEAVAKSLADKFRLILNKSVFALPIYEVPSSCLDLNNTLIIPIISNGAYVPIVKRYAENIKAACNDTVIYTTKSVAQELELTDGIVTVDDSIPLFNPITIATVMQQTLIETESETNSADNKTA